MVEDVGCEKTRIDVSSGSMESKKKDKVWGQE